MDSRLKQVLLDTIRRALEPEISAAESSQNQNSRTQAFKGGSDCNKTSSTSLLSLVQEALQEKAEMKPPIARHARLPAVPLVVPKVRYNPVALQSADTTLAEGDETTTMTLATLRQLVMTTQSCGGYGEEVDEQEESTADSTFSSVQMGEQYSMATMDYLKRHGLR